MWYFNQRATFTSTPLKVMAHDGYFVVGVNTSDKFIVLDTTKIYQNTFQDSNYYVSTRQPSYLIAGEPSQSIASTNIHTCTGALDIKIYDSKSYVYCGSTIKVIPFPYETMTSINVPTAAQSTMKDRFHLINGNLVLVADTRNYVEQLNAWKLHTYDLITETWTERTLALPSTTSDYSFTDSKNGTLLVTCGSTRTIHEFDILTGNQITQKTVGVEPININVNEDRDIIIGCINGDYYKWNYQTGDVAPYFSLSEDSSSRDVKIYDDYRGNYWCTGLANQKHFVKIRKSDKHVWYFKALVPAELEEETPLNDGSFFVKEGSPTLELNNSTGTIKTTFTGTRKTTATATIGAYPEASVAIEPNAELVVEDYRGDRPQSPAYEFGDSFYFPTKLNSQGTFFGSTLLASCMIPQTEVELWDGTQLVPTTIRPHLVLSFTGYETDPESTLTRNRTFVVRLTSMVRLNNIDVRGTAMVSVGPNDYLGG